MAADNINYKDAVVVTKLVKSEDGETLRLDLPFPIYSQYIYCEGQDVTYRLNDLSLEGKEVLANVHYSIINRQSGKNMAQTDDTLKVKNFSGVLLSPMKSLSYTKHYKELDDLGNPQVFCVSDALVPKKAMTEILPE